MNFLSHYYFERYTPVSEVVLGCLLPDLLKNVDKSYNFHPHRFEATLFVHPNPMHISEGWYRHVEVDKIFHSSPFFMEHNHLLRRKIEGALEGLPIRASFMAHIAIELILDHLLIKNELVKPIRLYEHLDHVQRPVIASYLRVIGLEDPAKFLAFYDRFISSRYLLDYARFENLSHALFSICKRIWTFEVTEIHHAKLTEQLSAYTEDYLKNFKEVFNYVQDRIV